MKSVVLPPGFQLGFANVLFKVWRNGNCARWPLAGALGFTWCEALLEGEAARNIFCGVFVEFLGITCSLQQ